MQKHLALLRGINVGGHKKVPMAQLRAAAEEAGYTGVKTYVASGNLVLGSTAGADIEVTLEQAIEKRFGFHVDVIVRSQQQWATYLRGNPFPTQSSVSPNLVMICVGKRAMTDDDLSAFRINAGQNEKVERTDDVLWLYFGDGSARSKLMSGSSRGVWTTRNWTTVMRLSEMLDGSD